MKKSSDDKKKATSKRNPYAEGRYAFEKGIPRDDYPEFDTFSDECLWIDGWDDARRKAATEHLY